MSATAATLRDIVAAASERLIQAGIGEPVAALDAEVLARHALGWDRGAYFARRADPAPDGFGPSFAPLIERRAQREPVHLILGLREFWGRDFEVTRDTLIPRPETELIIEEALLRFAPGPPSRIADIGTGTGCLAVTLALEFPASHVQAIRHLRGGARRRAPQRRTSWRAGAGAPRRRELPRAP